MSNFSQVLTELVDKRALKKGKLAKRTRLGKKQLTRILTGKKRSVSNGDYKRLAKAVTKDDLDRAHLLAARLMDACRGPGKELISIHVKGDKPKSAG